ncbi:hypothetical protein MRX96_031072 [Rhipicephalus microplus]
MDVSRGTLHDGVLPHDTARVRSLTAESRGTTGDHFCLVRSPRRGQLSQPAITGGLHWASAAGANIAPGIRAEQRAPSSSSRRAPHCAATHSPIDCGRRRSHRCLRRGIPARTGSHGNLTSAARFSEHYSCGLRGQHGACTVGLFLPTSRRWATSNPSRPPCLVERKLVSCLGCGYCCQTRSHFPPHRARRLERK